MRLLFLHARFGFDRLGLPSQSRPLKLRPCFRLLSRMFPFAIDKDILCLPMCLSRIAWPEELRFHWIFNPFRCFGGPLFSLLEFGVFADSRCVFFSLSYRSSLRMSLLLSLTPSTSPSYAVLEQVRCLSLTIFPLPPWSCFPSFLPVASAEASADH